jgi:hypothetical protein
LQKFVLSSFKVYLGTSSPPNAILASNGPNAIKNIYFKNKLNIIIIINLLYFYAR